MNYARLGELRLRAFKSYRDAVLPLHDVTVLIGRNSSGKSNALDGLEVLARLAGGEDLSDALDGRRREGGMIRGGSGGLPPHGSDSFALGCTVEVGEDRYCYDVEVQVAPYLRVVGESLQGAVVSVKSGKSLEGSLFDARQTDAPGIAVEVHNGKPGRNSPTTYRDDRLVLTQLPGLIAGNNRAEKSVLRGVDAVIGALRGLFHLDPLPYLMRDYVPERDSELRRTAENLSAVLRRLEREDPQALASVVENLRAVADDGVRGISFATSQLGDVMLVLDESRAGRDEQTPAREMSDGLLRFTAVATALLSPQHLDVEASPAGVDERGAVHMVIEELENGLHPSQARRVLELVRQAASPGASVLLTTHSPALLDAVEGVLNRSVYVTRRSPETGYSTITPLMKLPGYARALAERTLGGAVTADSLSEEPPQDFSEFEQLLGLA